jgi:RND family efflux transporter MFP subunit
MTLPIARTGALLALVGLAATSACKKQDANATTGADSTATPASAISLPVVGEQVTWGDLVLTVPTTGQVRSGAVATLRAEAAGTVAEVLVVPGQRVARGQALVRLDPRPFDLAVDEAEAAVAQAEVQYNDNIIPDSIVSGKAPSEERRANALARSGLQGARVRFERAKLDRDRATITAPFAGVIDRVNVAAGERLTAGNEVTTIVDVNDLRIEASVLEHDLPLIRAGGQAVITSSAAPGRHIIGRVAAVLPMIDSTTRAGRALVRFRNDGSLRPGMYADVRLESTRLANRTMVPAAAILERDGRTLVFVVQDGRAKWTYLTAGRSNGAETEVLPDSSTGEIPVKAGDMVLVEGHLTLTHDAPVRVVPKAE